jgi:hypothetical protein
MTNHTKRLHDSSVSRNLGTSVTPAAIRSTKPGWRDPRLWIGVAIVAASVLLGAKLIGGAEQSVAVWSVSKDMGSGDALTSGDLVERKVRFVNAADADVYLSADDPLPEGATLTRELSAGELLPRAAIGTDDSKDKTMSLVFAGAGVPTGLAKGDSVAVWVTSVKKKAADGTTTEDAPPSAAAVPETLVTSVQNSASGSLAGTGAMVVTIVIPSDITSKMLGEVVQAAKADNIYLTKVG